MPQSGYRSPVLRVSGTRRKAISSSVTISGARLTLCGHGLVDHHPQRIRQRNNVPAVLALIVLASPISGGGSDLGGEAF